MRETDDVLNVRLSNTSVFQTTGSSAPLAGGAVAVVGAGAFVTLGDYGRYLTRRPRGAARTSTLKVDPVINCTGPPADVAVSRIPLVQGLLKAGVVRDDPQGLALDVDEEPGVRDADGASQDELYAVGPMTGGAFWEMTFVPDIRIQAAEIAEMIAYRSG